MKTKNRVRHFITQITLLLGLAFSFVITDKVSADNPLPSEYIWVGDSHVTALAGVIGGVSPSRITGVVCGMDSLKNFWYSRSAKGFTWMKQTGIPNVSGRFGKNKALIIWMGTNDAYSYSSMGPVYVSYLNELSSRMKQYGMKAYFVNVAKINDYRSPYLKNRHIEQFNAIIKNGVHWNEYLYYVDLYSYTRGYTSAQITSDGFHYRIAACREIYNWVIARVNDISRKSNDQPKLPTSDIIKMKETGMGALHLVFQDLGSKVAGYQIRYSTDKNMKRDVRTASTNKTTTTRYGLVGGRTYYVSVRTYKVIKGKTWYSAWSKTRSLRLARLPKGTKLESLGKGSESFQAKWNTVSGVNGYQIRYSTSSRYAWQKTSSVAGEDKFSITINGLKKGKVYYVSVRSYNVAADGTRYYSAWSETKKIKI